MTDRLKNLSQKKKRGEGSVWKLSRGGKVRRDVGPLERND